MRRQASAIARICMIGALLMTTCMLAPSTAHARCDVFAYTPEVIKIRGKRELIGGGKRGPGCTVPKVLYVQLRWDRFLWPDELLAEVRVTVTNSKVRARYRCPSVLKHKEVFTETWVQGENLKDQSARVGFNC
jgi:hypothetical protein